MKTLLICPGIRKGVAPWAQTHSLAATPLFGQTLLEHWLEFLARQGAKSVVVLATDRPEELRTLVGDGARWGLQITVNPEKRELRPKEARDKYQVTPRHGWMPAPLDVVVADHFPEMPECPLFKSLSDGFAAIQARLRRVRAGERLGMREVRPGVWAGLQARISPKAELRAPCWIGNHVVVGPYAVVGPRAILEDRVLVERGATIAEAAVGPDTVVGAGVALLHSFAHGRHLINWRTGSTVQVPDAIWLAPAPRLEAGAAVMRWAGRMAALLLMELTVPLGAAAMLTARLRGQPAFHVKTAARPRQPGHAWPDTIEYYEMNCTNRWLKRWPQLWNVATGEFAWVGNRPLSPQQTVQFTTAFSRRWLDAPVGLVSLADSVGCYDWETEEAQAHAAFYAVRANWQLNLAILARTTRLLLQRAADKSREELSTVVPAPVSPTTQRL